MIHLLIRCVNQVSHEKKRSLRFIFLRYILCIYSNNLKKLISLLGENTFNKRKVTYSKKKITILWHTILSMNLEKLIIVKQNILSPSIMFYVPSSSSGERFETLKRSKLCCLLAGLLLLLNLNSTHAFSPITIHALTQKSVFKNRFDSSNYQH